MKEQLVRDIADAYFRQRHRKVSPQPGAGPDFLCGGTAIEVKGIALSQPARRRKALQQLVRYAVQYKTLEIFLPLEVLDIELAWSLFAIEAATSGPLGQRPITTYLATELSTGEYRVGQFPSLKELTDRIGQILRFKIWTSPPSDPEELIAAITNVATNVDAIVREALQDEAVTYWTKVELETL